LHRRRCIQTDRKKLIILVVVIVAVIALAAGAYVLLGGGGGGGGGGNPTPTPNPTSTPTPSPGVSGASSLRYSVDITTGGTSQGSYTYMAKNAGTSNMMIRIEITSTDGNLIYIVNGAQQKAWAYAGGTWQDLSSSFSTQWDSWQSTFTGYRDHLSGWTGGDYTYTAPNGDSVRIYSISVNPSLADSLFQP
jgi:hypothetical protein